MLQPVASDTYDLIAAKYPKRVATLACINQPHPSAVIEVMATQASEKQREGYKYFSKYREEGKELEIFETIMQKYEAYLPAEELDPYRELLNSEEALSSVFHWYRVLSIPAPKPVVMPTLYIWPKNIENVNRETAEAVAHHVKGPYRFEILDKALNFSLQMEHEKITFLLLEHLAEHAQVGNEVL